MQVEPVIFTFAKANSSYPPILNQVLKPLLLT